MLTSVSISALQYTDVFFNDTIAATRTHLHSIFNHDTVATPCSLLITSVSAGCDSFAGFLRKAAGRRGEVLFPLGGCEGRRQHLTTTECSVPLLYDRVLSRLIK